ncbi:MAG: hypothetical protein HY231_10300 [Acidobacteria bacterium]|nr:hypothetical protein [Acidobacteriota bacterium]
MKRRIPSRQDIIQQNAEKKTVATLDPNELKAVVRDGLSMMTLKDREEFIQVLEAEMKRLHLDLRAYLIPLGIPGRTTEELTPTEVGHLIRFLKINVPPAMKAVERALSTYHVFAATIGDAGRKLAA